MTDNTQNNTQNNPVNPFSVPPAGAGAVTSNDATKQPDNTTEGAAGAAGNQDLSTAIAQLTAVLGKGTGNGERSAAPAEEPSTDTFGNLNEFDIAGIENPAIKSMAYVLAASDAKLDLNRALGNALERFDASLVDTRYIAEVTGDPKKAENISQIARSIVEAAAAEANALTDTVFNLAGGESGWNEAAAVWNKSAPEALRAVVKTMLDSSRGEQVKAAAQLIVDFGKKSGQLRIQGSSVKAGGVAAGSAANGLSKAEFQSELQKLDPQDRNYSAAREDIFARRILGKQLGL